MVRFGALDRTAVADYSGQESCVYGEAGYVFYHEGFNIVPLASLRYAHISIGDYEETGAGALDLRVDEQEYDYLESGLGVKIAYPMEVESWRLLPEIRLKWLYEYIGDEIEITSRFTAGGPSFKTTGLGSPRSTIAVGGSLTVFTRQNLTFALDYDFAGKENYFSNNGSITLKYQF